MTMKILKTILKFAFAAVAPLLCGVILVGYYGYARDFNVKYLHYSSERTEGVDYAGTLAVFELLGTLFLLSYFGASYCNGKTDLTKLTGHVCDICSVEMEQGKGDHYAVPKESGVTCYCVCEKCRPTFRGVTITK